MGSRNGAFGALRHGRGEDHTGDGPTTSRWTLLVRRVELE